MSESASPELLAYRAISAAAREAALSYDDDVLDIMCEARAAAVRLSGRRDLARVPARADGEHIRITGLQDLAGQWRSAVPAEKLVEVDAAWLAMGRQLGALTETLHKLRVDRERAARAMADVLSEGPDSCWRQVHVWRDLEGRGAATYQVDDLLVLGYQAAVVHRYHSKRRHEHAHSFEVWAVCTEEGQHAARWQRPKDYKVGCLWHQLLVPSVDVRDEAEPGVDAFAAAFERCRKLRAGVHAAMELRAHTTRVP